jgi:hypothetical protein
MSFITAFFGAISNVFGWVTGRNAVENTAQMTAAKTAQSEQKQVDQTTKAVAGQNTKEIRDELAE